MALIPLKLRVRRQAHPPPPSQRRSLATRAARAQCGDPAFVSFFLLPLALVAPSFRRTRPSSHCLSIAPTGRYADRRNWLLEEDSPVRIALNTRKPNGRAGGPRLSFYGLRDNLDARAPWGDLHALQLRPRAHRSPDQGQGPGRDRLQRAQDETEVSKCRYISGSGHPSSPPVRHGDAASEGLAAMSCAMSFARHALQARPRARGRGADRSGAPYIRRSCSLRPAGQPRSKVCTPASIPTR
jgi:hypothetical protein